MASLSQTLRQKRSTTTKRGPGGQLSDESTEEVQSLAGQAGLQAPPINAVATGQIGGTAKQQDMAGSKAQKTAALSLASAPVESGLAAAMRRGQSRTEMTGQEQAQTTKSKDMQDLGGLGDRVTSFIDAQRQALQAQADTQVVPAAGEAATAPGLEAEAATTFAGKDISSIKSLLAQYRAAPGDMNVLLELNKALGYDTNKQLSPAEVDQLYESATDTIARGAAGNVDNDLTVEDLTQQGDFGYSAEELSSLLGLPADQVSKLNVAQLRAQIQKVGDEEFSQTQELEQKAQSGVLGQAERGLARQAAAEASSTGVRATEADYGNIEQQIQNADEVSFGGKNYNVEDLLKDETISGIIKEYMDAAPGSPLRTQIEKNEPALLSFINKNQAVLQDASSRMQAGAGEFKAIQEANKNLTVIQDGSTRTDLAPEIAAALIPGFGTLQASRIDPNSVPLLSAINSMPTGRKAAAVTDLNDAAVKYPNFTEQLSGLDAAELTRLNIGKKDSFFDQWKNSMDTRERIVNVSPENIGPEAFLAPDGSPITTNAFRTMQDDVRSLSAFGVDTKMPMDIADTAALKQKILDSSPEVSLKQAAGGNVPSYSKIRLNPPAKPAVDSKEGILYEWGKNYAVDGSIDAAEVRAISQKASQTGEQGLDYLMTLEDMANKPGAKIDKATVTSERQAQTDSNTRRNIGTSVQSGDAMGSFDRIHALLQSGDSRRYNMGLLKGEMNRMIESEAGSAQVNESILTKAKQMADAYGISSPALDARIAQYKAQAARNAGQAAAVERGRNPTNQTMEEDRQRNIAAARARASATKSGK